MAWRTEDKKAACRTVMRVASEGLQTLLKSRGLSESNFAIVVYTDEGFQLDSSEPPPRAIDALTTLFKEWNRGQQ